MVSNGSNVTLVNLIGTIPVASKQNGNRVIEVPLEICLPLNYPTDLPLIWVRPNILSHDEGGLRQSSTRIVLRTTENCDANGLVWGLEAFASCSLVDLIGIVQQMFEDQLPIVSAVSMPPIVANNLASPEATTEISASSQLLAKVEAAMAVKLKEGRVTFEVLLEEEKRVEGGDVVLRRELLMLSNEIGLINKEIEALNHQQAEMDRLVLESFSVKSPVVPSDPKSSQLLELLANESALMDALYALIKVTVTPVSSGGTRVSLTDSLRSIRELSRRQFLTKTHIRKIIK